MLDSGCTQHMTGESKMFASLDGDVSGYNDIIFGDNCRGEVKEWVTSMSLKIILFQMSC